MKVTIQEVVTKKDLRQFVHYPNALYKDNPYYVPTLESGDRDVLDPKKNHAFEFCEGKYWLARNEKGAIVGRIAGIINHQYNQKMGIDYARFGFMDFIDDDTVVDALFDTVEAWAREKGMKVMNGPLGFLEFDASGVLVAGFDELPTAYGKYNFPYYEPQLLRRGYAERMVLAHDASCFIDWFDPEAKRQVVPRWNFRHISEDVIPALLEGGASQGDIDTMLVDNPRRYFE